MSANRRLLRDIRYRHICGHDPEEDDKTLPDTPAPDDQVSPDT